MYVHTTLFCCTRLLAFFLPDCCAHFQSLFQLPRWNLYIYTEGGGDIHISDIRIVVVLLYSFCITTSYSMDFHKIVFTINSISRVSQAVKQVTDRNSVTLHMLKFACLAGKS